MPIESYTIVEGQRVNDPGDATPAAPTAPDVASGTESAAPGATPSPQAGGEEPSASPTDTPSAEGGEPSAETDDDEPLRDDSEVNAERLNRRFARLTAARRKAERERDALSQQHQVELAQLRGQNEAIQRMLQGAAPESVVRGGLAGKVSPVLQQALMLVPDGPAVAYTLAQQPELVQRLNTLPPPLVLVELGRLSPAAPQTPAPTPAVGSTNGNGQAPPTLHAPETPLSGAGGGAPTGSYRDDMSMDEYKAWRKRTSQLAAWKER
jgi:hypothetical protein